MVQGAILAGLSGVLASAVTIDSGSCLALREPVPAGAFLTLESANEVPCSADRKTPPLRYDQAVKAPVTIEDLAAGTYLGKISLKPGTIAVAGEKLQLVLREGPVTIVRDVTTARAVRDRDHTFVKTEDGEILSAQFVAAEPRQ